MTHTLADGRTRKWADLHRKEDERAKGLAEWKPDVSSLLCALQILAVQPPKLEGASYRESSGRTAWRSYLPGSPKHFVKYFTNSSCGTFLRF